MFNSNFKIGIEHEKFLFDDKTNKRLDYLKIKEMFSALIEFGWNPIVEQDNIIGLNKGGKNITLEPGNQIELSGDKLNNIHEGCAESQNYLFELRQVTKKLGINIVSAGFDPISKLNEIPNNPKQRYKLMTKDMPLGGNLSLDMMYRTCGTQINLDYNSEEDFIKKFKIVNSIVPISIALFANSSIVEKKQTRYLSYRSKVWQNTSRGGLPKIFFDDLDFGGARSVCRGNKHTKNGIFLRSCVGFSKPIVCNCIPNNVGSNYKHIRWAFEPICPLVCHLLTRFRYPIFLN